MMLLRSLVLAAVLLAPLPPAAGAAPFTVDWGGAVGMTANGWHVKSDPPGSALCGWEGGGTVFLNAGALGTNQGCHYVFDAPGAAAISGVAVSYDFNRAHASSSLCLRSFMGGTSTAPLTRCTSVSGAHETVLGAASSWIQLGLFYTGAPTSVGTARANNAVLHSGSVMLDDPTPPSVSGTPPGVVTGTSFALPWSATDPESSIGQMQYRVDGGPLIGVLGDGCRSRWLCGATRTGTAVVSGLGPLADGAHTLALVAGSAGGSATAQIPFTVDQDPPLPARLSLTANPFALAGAVLAAAGDALGRRRVSGRAGGLHAFELHDAAGLRWSTQTRGARVPITLSPSLGQPGAWRAVVRQCSASGCSSGELPFSWDTLLPPPARSEPDAPWLGAAAGRAGAQLPWPALTTALGPVSGVRHGFVGVGRSPEEAAAAARSAAAGWAPPSGGPAAGTFGTTVAALPAALVHGAARACVAVVPVSGAGAPPAAGSQVGQPLRPGRRDRAERLGRARPSGWHSGEVAVEVAARDEGGSGLASSAVTLDGAAVTPVGGAVVVRGEGRHAVEVSARDGAGNAADPARAAVAIDATAPALAGPVRVSFVERDARGLALGRARGRRRRDALAGRQTARDGRRGAGRRAPHRHRPRPRARRARAGRRCGERSARAIWPLPPTASPPPPGSCARAAPRTSRTPRSGPASRGRCRWAAAPASAGGSSTRPAQAIAGERVALHLAPLGGRETVLGTAVSDRSGRFAREVHPRRSGAAVLRHDGSEVARPAAPMRTATLAVSARITGASVRPRGERLVGARPLLGPRRGRPGPPARAQRAPLGGRVPGRRAAAAAPGRRRPHHRLLPDPADRAGPALALSHQARGPDDDVAVARRSQRSGSGVPSPSLAGGEPGMPAQSA